MWKLLKIIFKITSKSKEYLVGMGVGGCSGDRGVRWETLRLLLLEKGHFHNLDKKWLYALRPELALFPYLSSEYHNQVQLAHIKPLISDYVSAVSLWLECFSKLVP